MSDLMDNLHPPDEYDLLAQELDVVGPAMKNLDEYLSFITKTPISIDCSQPRHLLGSSVKSSNNSIPVYPKRL